MTKFLAKGPPTPTKASKKSTSRVSFSFSSPTQHQAFRGPEDIKNKSRWYAILPLLIETYSQGNNFQYLLETSQSEIEIHANASQSDVEEQNDPVEVTEADEVEVSGDAASKGQMSVLDALKGVLKLALMHDGLARGLREASKALDRRQAHMCVLNEACEEEAYKKLVVALCSEHKIPLIKVPDGKQLGEWAGLCEYSPCQYSGKHADGFQQVCWTVRVTLARLSTALALSSRIGVRSLRSDRSFSTTSKPSSKSQRMDLWVEFHAVA
jgi:small subunit ribosomal protein S12e